MRRRRLPVLLAALGLLAGPPAAAEDDAALLMRFGVEPVSALPLEGETGRRFAIVIGNNDYEATLSLTNARNDAVAMAEFLRAHGFRVFEEHNLDKRGFETLLRRVLYEITPDSEVLFYYAGHGIQIGRRNYLLPTDATLRTPYDTPFETVTLESILAFLAARSRLQVVILDSCRNNPFGRAQLLTEIDPTLYETVDGFSAVAAPFNTYVAYSTAPGAVAMDGDGSNSPFTASLVETGTVAPAEPITLLFGQVRRLVYERTGGRQIPWDTSSLVEDFAFAPPEGAERTRGLVLSSMTRVADAVPATAAGGAARLAAPLEREVGIGAALADAFALAPGETIEIGAGALRRGALVLGTAAEPYRGQPLDRAALAGLAYAHAPQPVAAAAPGAGDPVVERLFVTGPRIGTQEVELTLTPDPCDVAAGDWLDPGGIGLARFPNELAPEAALAACDRAVARAPQVGRFHYQRGRALQAMTRFEEARAAYATARDRGHVRAFHALGDLEADAAAITGGKADTGAGPEAMRLYALGVQAGDPYAYHALGKQLLRHGETEELRASGYQFLARAIELGHTFAMNELGYQFLREGSEYYQPQRGLRFLQESADRGDIYGFHNLGLVYERGLGGVPPDPKAAAEWYRRAAEGGHPNAPVNIGLMYAGGAITGRPEVAQAVRWFDEGLARGIAWGGTNAAFLIARDGPEGYAPEDAAVRAAKAAVLRDPEAAKGAAVVLDALDARTLDRGTQLLMRELGETVTVDGAIGPASRTAIERLTGAPAGATARERLLALARIYWSRRKFRTDLY